MTVVKFQGSYWIRNWVWFILVSKRKQQKRFDQSLLNWQKLTWEKFRLQSLCNVGDIWESGTWVIDWGRFSLFYLQSHHLYGFMYSLTWTIWPLLKVIIILVMMLIMAITRWSWRRWLRGSQRRVQQTSSCTTKRMQVVKITTKVFLKRKYKEKYNKYKYKYNKEDAGSEHLFLKVSV